MYLQIRDQIGGALPRGELCAGAGVQGPDARAGLTHLLLGGVQRLGDGAVLAAGQVVELTLDDGQRQGVRPLPLELERQTLGQVLCPYPGGVQGLELGKACFHVVHGHVGRLGKLVQRVPQIAVPVQAQA